MKAPITNRIREDYVSHHCGKCGEQFGDSMHDETPKFCHECGSRLDWSTAKYSWSEVLEEGKK